MKKILLLTIGMLFIASSAWALYIFDTEFVDVGIEDTLVTYAQQSEIGAPNDANEIAWINEVTGSNYALSDYTKLENDDLHIYRTYTDTDVSTITDYTFALSFGTAAPEYFLLKCGNAVDGNTEGTYTNFLLRNDNESLNWGVFNLYGYDDFSVFEIDNVSHSGTAGSAPVPEPATMLLLGSGLIGIAGIRKRISKEG